MDIDWIAVKLDWYGLEFDYNGLGCLWIRMDWIGLHWFGCVAVHICVALDDRIVRIEWISIGLHLSWIRLNCIGGGLDWIGSVIFLLDCIGLGYFNSRSVKNWIGLHCVGCVAFHICVALNDWTV